MLASPNAIPPRTSSSGLHSHSNSLSYTTPRPILKPVAEADWLAQKQAQAEVAELKRRRNSPDGLTQKPHHRHHSSSFGASPSAEAYYHSPTMHPVQPATSAPPPPDPIRYMDHDLDFRPERSWNADKERIVRGPFDYVISHPGKDFRSQLIGSFNAWLDVPAPSLAIITRVVGMLHESSLLVDDVQDNSELRRGFPVAHNIFGVAQTINSANYIYFAALQELQQLNNPNAIAMFAEELVNLHRGQGMDLFWRDTLTCPTEEDYLEMVGNKTGGLFRLGIKLMQAESGTDIDCSHLVNLIGLIFQIRDDYMNLSSQEYSNNKGMCEDLTEGKFSFPVIHAVRADPTNLQLINILKQKTTDLQVKRYAVQYMKNMGSFEYTRKVLTVLIERARKTAEQIDAGSGRMAGIQKILNKMVVE